MRKWTLSFVIFALLSAVAAAQQYVISSYAGGSPPPTPAAGLNASIGSPLGVATDSAGNVFFTSLNCVFKLDPNGTVTRVAGSSRPGYSGDGGPAFNAELSTQSEGVTEVEYSASGGLAIDRAGNIYIADSGNHRVRKVSPDGIIATVAGNGTAGYSGDGGPATGAQLHTAVAVAVDTEGNLYIAEDRNHRIRKVSSGGIITTVAGNGTFGFSGDGGPATSARIGVPLGVAVDREGNVYIAATDDFFVDNDTGHIRKVSPAGIITTVGGSVYGGPGFVTVDSAGNLYFYERGIRKVSPDGIITVVPADGIVAVDNAGNLYIAGNQRIRKFSGGVITTLAGNGASGDGGPAANAQLNLFPWGGVALDSEGSLYIASGGLGVRKVSPDGTITTVPGTANSNSDGYRIHGAEPNFPSTLAVDRTGDLYVANRNRVHKVSAGGIVTTFAGNGGEPGYSGDGGPATGAQLYNTRGLALDSAGNLYIADTKRVRKVSPDGIITTAAGGGNNDPGDGGPATRAQLNNAWAIDVDNAGNLYIADIEYNSSGGKYRVRKVSPDGIISTVAGDGTFGYSGDGGPATGAQLNGPVGLAVDSAGNLFIADTYNGRVRRVSPDGIITTVAGTGVAGYSGDGGPANSAQFGSLSGLAIDSAGNLYALDQRYNVVRLLQPVRSSLAISGVTNAASNLPGPIAPGEIVVVTGSTQLAGTTVQFNGAPAPLIPWGAQVAAMVPYSLFGDSAHVTITRQGQTSAPLSIPLAPSAPGLFTLDQTGKGQAAAVNQDGSINTTARPAKVGEFISLYATGVGQTLPSGEDGKPVSPPLPRPILPVSVTIDGRTAPPAYAGGAPGEVAGVIQINVQIPSGIPTGAAPVVVQVGNASSQAGVTIAVQ